VFEWLLGKPTRKRLLRDLFKALKANEPRLKVAPSADETRVELTWPDGRTATLDLERLFRDWSALARVERDALLARCVAEISAADLAPALRLEALRPRLITTAGLQARLLQVLPQLDPGGGPFNGRLPLERIKGRIAARPIAGALHVAVVEDLPAAVAFLLETKGSARTFDDRLRRAMANLRASAGQPFLPVRPGVFAGETKDLHGATTMLLEEKVRALPIVGQPVVFAPCSELCLVTGSGDVKGLEHALSQARGVYESGKVRPLTAEAFVLTDGHWLRWSPPERNPMRESLRAFQELHRAEEYALQAELLSRTQLPAPAERVYFSSNRQGEPVPGKAPSASLWEQSGGEQLLAEADYVGFMPEKGTPAFVRWFAAVEVLGERMRPVEGLVPPRFHVREFPSSSELQLMSSLSATASGQLPN
jgi:hypothetical protein